MAANLSATLDILQSGQLNDPMTGDRYVICNRKPSPKKPPLYLLFVPQGNPKKGKSRYISSLWEVPLKLPENTLKTYLLEFGEVWYTLTLDALSNQAIISPSPNSTIPINNVELGAKFTPTQKPKNRKK